MTDEGEAGEAPDDESTAAEPRVHGEAWQWTLEEMQALEDELQADGWETVSATVGHTAPRAPSEATPWGLVHTVPGDDAAAIQDVFSTAQFPSFTVYRATFGGRVFGVVVLFDPDTAAAVLLAHQFSVPNAADLVAHTKAVDHVNTVVRFLDGTIVGQVRHEDPEKFFPRYEAFDEFADEVLAAAEEAAEADDGGPPGGPPGGPGEPPSGPGHSADGHGDQASEPGARSDGPGPGSGGPGSADGHGSHAGEDADE